MRPTDHAESDHDVVAEVALADETTAADVPGWDSLNHITLIGTVEDEFDVKFPMKDVVGMKNVGELVDKIIELSA